MIASQHLTGIGILELASFAICVWHLQASQMGITRYLVLTREGENVGWVLLSRMDVYGDIQDVELRWVKDKVVCAFLPLTSSRQAKQCGGWARLDPGFICRAVM